MLRRVKTERATPCRRSHLAVARQRHGHVVVAVAVQGALRRGEAGQQVAAAAAAATAAAAGPRFTFGGILADARIAARRQRADRVEVWEGALQAAAKRRIQSSSVDLPRGSCKGMVATVYCCNKGTPQKGRLKPRAPVPPTCVLQRPHRVWGTAAATGGASRAGLRSATSTRPCGNASLHTSTTFTKVNAHHSGRLLFLRPGLDCGCATRRVGGAATAQRVSVPRQWSQHPHPMNSPRRQAAAFAARAWVCAPPAPPPRPTRPCRSLPPGPPGP